jgi:hypothetical protein
MNLGHYNDFLPFINTSNLHKRKVLGNVREWMTKGKLEKDESRKDDIHKEILGYWMKSQDIMKQKARRDFKTTLTRVNEFWRLDMTCRHELPSDSFKVFLSLSTSSHHAVKTSSSFMIKSKQIPSKRVKSVFLKRIENVSPFEADDSCDDDDGCFRRESLRKEGKRTSVD